MKQVEQPWRDPTFFGFLLFGLALLAGALACQTRARELDRRTLPVATGLLRPTELPAAPRGYIKSE